MRFGGFAVLAVLWLAAPVVAVLLIGHTAPVGPLPSSPGGPGVLLGFWHGFILPIAFVMSLLRDDVAIYAVQHDGEAYDVGFVLGVLVMGWGWAPRFSRTRSSP